MPDKIEEAARYLSAVVDCEGMEKFEDEARRVVNGSASRQGSESNGVNIYCVRRRIRLCLRT